MSNLQDFIQKNGTPRWDKVFYKVKPTSAGNRSTARSSGDSSTGQGLLLIPLQSTSSNKVQSYITAYKHNDSSYNYRLYNKDSLDNVHPVNDSSKLNLLNTQAAFGYFEKSINGKDSILVNNGNRRGYIKNASLRFTDSIKNNLGGRTNQKTSDLTCNISMTIAEEYFFVGIFINGQLAEGMESYSCSIYVEITCVGGEGDSDSNGYGIDNWADFGTGYPYSYNSFNDPTWQYWWTGYTNNLSGWDENGLGFKLCKESFNFIGGVQYSYWETNMNNLRFTDSYGNINSFSAYYNLLNEISDSKMNQTIYSSPLSSIMPQSSALDYLHAYFPDLFSGGDIIKVWDSYFGIYVWRFSKYAAQEISSRCSNLASKDVQAQYPYACNQPGFIPAQIAFRTGTEAYLNCFIPDSRCRLQASSSSNNSLAKYTLFCD